LKRPYGGWPACRIGIAAQFSRAIAYVSAALTSPGRAACAAAALRVGASSFASTAET